MPSSQRTLRVFISSSMSELEEERKVIDQIIAEEGYEPFLYERDALARDQNHETTFTSELQASHIYVGVFWKTFGKYTAQEFALAEQHGLPCLIFERYFQIEEREQALQQLLHEYNQVSHPQGKTIKRFTSVDDLRIQFQESFKGFLADAVKRAYTKKNKLNPLDLPCLCDRGPQMTNLRAAISQKLGTGKTRPFLWFLPGQANESHRKFRDRIETFALDELLPKANSLEVSYKVKPIRESLATMESTSDVRAAICSQVHFEPVADPLTETDQEDQHILNGMLSNDTKVFLIVISLLDREWKQGNRSSMKEFCEFWANFPDVPEDALIGGLVCLQEEHRAPSPISKLWRWALPVSKASRPAGIFQASIDQCVAQYRDRVDMHIFHRMQSPTQKNVQDWLDENRVKDHRGGRDMSPSDIAKLFPVGQTHLPMDDLYPKLQNLIEPSR